MCDQLLTHHALHFAVDLLDAGFALRQINLGKDHAQGGGGISHEVCNALPILRLAGILIAGDDSPPCAVYALKIGQQDLCCTKTDLFVHDSVSSGLL